MKTIEELKEFIYKHNKEGWLDGQEEFQIALYDEDGGFIWFDDIYVDDENEESEHRDKVVLNSNYHETSYTIDEVLGVKNGKVEIKLNLINSMYSDYELLDISKTYLMSIEKVKVEKTFTNLIDGSVTKEIKE